MGLQHWEVLWVYSIGKPCQSHSSGFCGFMAVGDLRWALRADSIWRPYGATASKHHLVFRGLVESAQNQPLQVIFAGKPGP